MSHKFMFHGLNTQPNWFIKLNDTIKIASQIKICRMWYHRELKFYFLSIAKDERPIRERRETVYRNKNPFGMWIKRTQKIS